MCIHCGVERLVLQELYLLDTSTYTLQRVAQSTNYPQNISFSPLNKLFLVQWQPDGDDVCAHDQYFEVYSCTGQHHCSFKHPDEMAWFDPPVAHLLGNRAAIAHGTSFCHWDFKDGLLLGTAGPGHDIETSIPGYSLLAANNSCSRLLFCHVRFPTLYMYDAVSLQLMSTLLPGAGASSQSLMLGAYDVQPGLVWGVYGLLLLHNVSDQHADPPGYAQTLELLQIQAGCSSYDVVSLAQGWGQEELARSSCSPCGNFLCRLARYVPEIQVHILRSGQVVLRHMVQQAMRSGVDARLCFDAAVHWSSCGCRVMVVVHTSAEQGTDISEHLSVLQFA